jgi:hypothetical protein
MKEWYFIWLFCTTLFIVSKYVLSFLYELFMVTEPKPIKLTWIEQLVLAVSVAYLITYFVK